jgi:hypothetical protein
MQYIQLGCASNADHPNAYSSEQGCRPNAALLRVLNISGGVARYRPHDHSVGKWPWHNRHVFLLYV